MDVYILTARPITLNTVDMYQNHWKCYPGKGVLSTWNGAYCTIVLELIESHNITIVQLPMKRHCSHLLHLFHAVTWCIKCYFVWHTSRHVTQWKQCIMFPPPIMSWVVDKKKKNMFTHGEKNRFLITDFFVFLYSPSGFYHGMGESTLGYHWFRQWVCRLIGGKTLIRPNHYNCLVETSETNLTFINANHFFQELHFRYHDDLQDILHFIHSVIAWYDIYIYIYIYI